jgi:hypothetical protein
MRGLPPGWPHLRRESEWTERDEGRTHARSIDSSGDVLHRLSKVDLADDRKVTR